MSDEGGDELLHRALLRIRELRGALDAREQAAHEPIAVVGMSCVLPGATTLDAFWQLLASGRCTVQEVPASRWDGARFFHPDPEHAGTAYTRHGSFLDDRDVLDFDAAFFGISPRDALALDPQHRLLLRVVADALDDAALDRSGLRGGPTALFAATGEPGYAGRHLLSGDRTRIDGAAKLGSTRSIGVGRIAYWLDTRGPALHVDTSCSSSLVALHLATQELRGGQCNLAIVAAANLMLSPEDTIGFSKLRALSPSGQCRAFDAAADGYVRGEGAGALVLCRLSDVAKLGLRARALVRGTGLNHDGRSNGLTAPNGQAQTVVIRRALDDARMSASDVQYVEAHGTGTPLGDPIEAIALAQALERNRPDAQPLALGSVKTNVGHLEAAAGVVAIIKTALAIERATLPPSLGFSTPNPHVPWARSSLTVQSELAPWPSTERPRCAGVSGFGMSGTNAHVILSEAPPIAGELDAHAAPRLVFVSSHDEAVLERQLAAFSTRVEACRGPAELACVAYTAARGRTPLRRRAALLVPTTTSGSFSPRVLRATAGLALGHVRVSFAGEPNWPEWLDAWRKYDPIFAGVVTADAGLFRAITGHEPTRGLVSALSSTRGTARRDADFLVKTWIVRWLDGFELAPRLVGGVEASLIDACRRDECSTQQALAYLREGSFVRPTGGGAPPQTDWALMRIGESGVAERDGAALVLDLFGGTAFPEAPWLGVLAQLYVHGLSLRADALFAGERLRPVEVPSSALAPQPCFLPCRAAVASGESPSMGWLRHCAEVASTGESIFALELSPSRAPHLADHFVLGANVVAGASIASAFLDAAGRLEEEGFELRGLRWLRPLLLSAGEQEAQIVCGPPRGEGRMLRLFARPDPGAAWVERAHAQLVKGSSLGSVMEEPRAAAPSPHATVDDDFYDGLSALGYGLGPSFRWLSTEVVDLQSHEYSTPLVHPYEHTSSETNCAPAGLLDACFQALARAAMRTRPQPGVFVPYEVDALRLRRALPPAHHLALHVRVIGAPHNDVILGQVRVYDESREVLLDLEGITMRQVDAARWLAHDGAGAGPSHGRDRSQPRSAPRRDAANHGRSALPLTRELRDLLRGWLCENLGLELAALDDVTAVAEVGADSVALLEMRTEIEHRFGIALSAGDVDPGMTVTDVANLVLRADAESPVEASTEASTELLDLTF